MALTISLFQRPGSILFLDDDPDYLDMLGMVVPPNWQVELFSRPSGFAERMRQVFRRDSDILLRLGGEEFAVLMPDTTLEQAMLLAERFRAELSEHPLKIPGLDPAQHPPLTCSLGVGTFQPLCDDSAEAFYTRVDNALYRAKAGGRNRLELA